MILLVLMASLLASQPIRLEGGPLPVGQAFEIKRTLGETAFSTKVDAAISRLSERAEGDGPCPTSAEAGAAAQLELVRRTDDPAAFVKARAAALAALAERRKLRARYLGGTEAPFPYNLVGHMAALARAHPASRLGELYRRMAEDQFARIDSQTLKPFLGPGVHTSWEMGLDPGALAYVNAVVENEWCAIDRSNTAWLKADLSAHGWFRISTFGADADSAAWALVQHARHDPTFQKDVLAMLELLWRAGETKGANYANLYDQTARLDGRPGRFGMDGDCTGPGVWAPAAQEDPAQTDAWRAKAGLPPLAAYVAARSRGCTD